MGASVPINVVNDTTTAGLANGSELDNATTLTINANGTDPATTVFVKGARYDKIMEAFGGVGVQAETPDALKQAVDAALVSGKPTLINAVLDPAAGSESGRIGNLNPQSTLKKK